MTDGLRGSQRDGGGPTMTAEEFQAEYQIGDRITEGDVVSCWAEDLLGSAVLVHFLVKDEAGSRSSLLNYLPRLDTAHAEKIRILTEVDGVPVLVTDLLEGFTSLADWLEAAAGGKAVRDPGVYTRILGNLHKTAALGETAVHGAAELRAEAPPDANPPADASIPETRVLDAEEMGRISGQTIQPEPPPPESEVVEPDRPESRPEPHPREPRKEQPSPPPKKTGRPGAYTMVFGEGHGFREASPPDAPALAETRVTPTSGNRLGAPSEPGTTPPPSDPGTTSAPTPPVPAPPATTPQPSSGMSPAMTWILIILALVIGVTAGAFLLG